MPLSTVGIISPVFPMNVAVGQRSEWQPTEPRHGDDMSNRCFQHCNSIVTAIHENARLQDTISPSGML